MLLHGCVNNLRFYNTVLSACAKASQWQHAVSLLRSMASESLPATVVSYNAAPWPWRWYLRSLSTWGLC